MYVCILSGVVDRFRSLELGGDGGGREMNVSHPSVHPVEAPPFVTEGENVPTRVRMKNIQGMPGTIGGLILRLFQFVFAVVALSVMATTSDFPSVTAFCYVVAASGWQSLWRLSLAIVDTMLF